VTATPTPTPTGPTATPFPPRVDLLIGMGGNEVDCTQRVASDPGLDLTVSVQSLTNLAGLDGEAQHTLFKTIYIPPGLTADDVTTLRAMVAPGGFIDEFASAGGAAVIHLAGPGLVSPDPNLAPGGVGFRSNSFHNSEDILAPAHPYITGMGFGGIALTGAEFAGWGPTDEGFLINLPPGATTILANVDGPSLVEYPFGEGKVLVSTLPFCTDGMPATQGDALENLLRYSPFFEGLARTPGFTVTATPTATPTPTGPTLTPSVTRTRPPTATRTPTPSPGTTETGTPTPATTATDTPTVLPSECVADCNTDAVVTVDELVLTVAVSMGDRPLDDCRAADRDVNEAVTIDEVVVAVGNGLRGCAVTE
jgi:hypothetical protein